MKGVSVIDKTDKKILNVLQDNGRRANKDIAGDVGMVPSAISERIKKLKDKGVIKKFETRLDPVKVEKNLLAFVYVTTNEQVHGWDTGHKLSEVEEIQEVYNVAGEDCYLIKVRVKDTKGLSDLLREKIGVIDTVVSTRTTIVLDTYKETCHIKLD